MNEEELRQLGFEIFNFVKSNFPDALTWPVRSRYCLTSDLGDKYCIMYEATFKSRNSNLYDHDALWVPKEYINDWSHHIYWDSSCRINIKNVTK